ncbi:cbb3-type cytochrome c oxidase subunit 3 [Ramlibacter sp. RBP-2]|uniref:Cbb3-type cytochrome c oxidase subunit 3 n=1 Tax=Ramlibacter lithotrophicus TaxID=2606681 RepID=A0A7X6I656_9BURK|nr:cbb3-type cytochrome c oxidase subunit 3 [Ramlibacter lithotrophicus]NKE65769.1 cbb3-type cytochrome c oxidase subunit 3 [Ramlibacter lithotrophicus]
MDITFLRIASTLASLVAFLAIVWWAYDRRNREHFQEAGQIPFDHDQ